MHVLSSFKISKWLDKMKKFYTITNTNNWDELSIKEEIAKRNS